MSYASTVLADGAVGFWELSEPTGSTATDQKANQNGTYQNTGSVTLGQPGIPGGGGATAAKFSKVGGAFCRVADAATQHVGDTFSIEVWVKFTSIVNNGGLFGTNFGSNMPIMYTNTSGNILAGVNASGTVMTSTITLSADVNFHHIVWSKSTATNRLSIDGVDVSGTVTNFTASNNNGWQIGGFSGGATVDGTMAMVALYPSALSPTQVSNHYTLGSTASSGDTGQFGGAASLLMMLREGS